MNETIEALKALVEEQRKTNEFLAAIRDELVASSKEQQLVVRNIKGAARVVRKWEGGGLPSPRMY